MISMFMKLGGRKRDFVVLHLSYITTNGSSVLDIDQIEAGDADQNVLKALAAFSTTTPNSFTPFGLFDGNYDTHPSWGNASGIELFALYPHGTSIAYLRQVEEGYNDRALGSCYVRIIDTATGIATGYGTRSIPTDGTTGVPGSWVAV